ncbi:MAG TPA: glutathione synthase, partial [Methylotenera sp.]|nr:glutathione synthase [Methylotenera sp.]
MKLLFIIDPLDSLKIYKDTSVAIMREAASRGHKLHICLQHDVFLRNELVKINAAEFHFTEGVIWYTLNDKTEIPPEDFDAIIMRKDPPFDNEYLYSTYLLELAVSQGAHVLNNPSAVRGWNEKLSVAKFPQFAPEFLVTSNVDLIRAFLNEQQDIIVKPL